MDNDKKDNNLRDKNKGTIMAKSQKLAGAIYVVTGFLHDNDPLKWKLRDQALAISVTINPDNVEQSLSILNQMVSFIEVALAGSQVSKMNFSILKEEYLSLGRLLLESPSVMVSLPEPSLVSTVATPNSPVKRQMPERVERPKGQVIADTSPRREQILNYIRQHRDSSIKDIAKAVPNFSSKTVQRELAELVHIGVVKREGDRRWSRYSL